MGVSPDAFPQKRPDFRVLVFCLLNDYAFERCINIIG